MRFRLWDLCLRMMCCVWCCTALCASANADFYVPWEALPPGYQLPREPDVESTFKHTHAVGELRLAERNWIFHFVQLDQSPQNWADHVLRISMGSSHEWSPKEYYAVLPSGYREEPDRAVVFMATRKIRFGEKFNPDSVEPLRSTSDPRHTLSRIGEHLVVSRAADRRWYFETPDQGNSWRIAMIEDIKRPGKFTRMEYLNDHIVAIRYPNGKRATIDYESGRPVRIQTPFGQRAEIYRGSSGYITRIDIFRDEEGFDPGPPAASISSTRPSHRSPQRIPALSYIYERDAEGRITQYTDPYGRVFKLDYQIEQSTEANMDKVVYRARITNEGDGTYLERRHEARPRQKEWFIHDHYGRKGQSISDNEVANAIRMTQVNNRWSVVGRSHGSANRHTNIQVDRRGLPETSVEPTGLTRVTEHDSDGNQTRVVESDGRTRISTFNSFGQPISQIDQLGQETLHDYDDHGRLLLRIDPQGRESRYEYAMQCGFPVATEHHDMRHEFDMDDWGRIVGVYRHDGTGARWSFNRFGDLETVTMLEPAAKKVLAESLTVNEKATTFLRDDRGRLVTIAKPEGATQIAYNPAGRLHAIIDMDGNRILYRYDDGGRISHKQDPKRRFESWTYHPSGRIATHRYRDTDEMRWTEKVFNAQGKLLSERVTGNPPLRNEYDDLGRLIRTDYPDGTWSKFTYDARNRMIAIRGTHQDAVNYSYHNSGNRQVAPINNTPEVSP